MAWTTIPNSLVAVGAKPFATTMQAFRDNIEAVAGKDASVPQNLRLGNWLLGTVNTPSGDLTVTYSLSGLDLSSYDYLIVEPRVSFSGVTVPLRINGQAFGTGSGDNRRGRILYSLSDGLAIGHVNSTSSDVILTSVTNATTAITASFNGGGNWNGGSFSVWGVR